MYSAPIDCGDWAVLPYAREADLGSTVVGDAVMSGTTFFTQDCPTCGRGLQVRVTYLGKTVVCRHCRGRFLAQDPESFVPHPEDSSEAVLLRVEELLATADEKKRHPR